MSISSLPGALQGPAQKAADILKANGATRAVVFGAATSSFAPGNEITIAVEGLDDDHLLRAAGRILMDAHLDVELSNISAGAVSGVDILS